MLVKTEGGSTGARHQMPSKPPGILDSPTLARVERAMLRHEEGAHRDGAHLHRAAYTQVRLFHLFDFFCEGALRFLNEKKNCASEKYR